MSSLIGSSIPINRPFAVVILHIAFAILFHVLSVSQHHLLMTETHKIKTI